MLDAHNHLHRLADPDGKIDAMKAAGLTGCVVNGTSESDWPEVAALAKRHPGFVVPAFGLHPWFAHRRSAGWLDELRAFLEGVPGASLGECGLDRWVDEPDLDTQRAAFLPQLRLARELKLPVTIHALKAWEPLFEAFDREPLGAFLLHSFNGSPELVERLVPLGARFSFSGHFLHPRKARVVEAFRAVPAERLLLETDAPEMRPPDECVSHPLPDGHNHPANLPAIARALAARLGRDPDELVASCERNARRFFNC